MRPGSSEHSGVDSHEIVMKCVRREFTKLLPEPLYACPVGRVACR